ncbi:Zn-dependent hydrolase [Corynebacterium pelargi]|uniref:Putative metallo-hydrolase n=2 Tax=Corynebacterium pelargi TaxID=1471400 RepID=A0A410W953_9CORY|nr:putative metallo-hydrolase [Corynebacterium pelargi]GGG76737.1 Zn-dependent hydrolase [Corynebacterium pelargi]
MGLGALHFLSMEENSSNTTILDQISVSDMDNNCYLLVRGDQALLIDAADNTEELLALAKRHNATITAVVTTHQHWDHVRALEELLERTQATHIAPAPDASALPAEVDIALEEGDALDFEGLQLEAHILRGHTPGGLALSCDIDGTTHLFVGDSLFPGGVGKTNSPEEFEQLFSDVKERIFDVYPDEAIVHPGHGKPTTLGQERPQLDQWRERGY